MNIQRDTVQIQDLSSSGEGVGRASDGRVLFVPLTAPGDRVDVRITRRRKRHGFAVLESVVEAGEGRVAPKCDLFGVCGGCDWQHLHYVQQVKWKGHILWQTLKRVGRIELEEPPEVFGVSSAYGARTRARMPVSRDQTPGFYQRASKHIVEVHQCPVLSSSLNVLLKELSIHLPNLSVHISEVRLLGTDEHVVLSLHMPEHVRVTQKIQDALAQWMEQFEQAVPNLKGATVWQERRQIGTFGEPWLWVGEPAIRYRAEGFAQASFSQNRLLVQKVVSLIQPKDGLQLVEVYAGRGNLSLALAQAGARILALDFDRQAIEDGRAAALACGLEERAMFEVFHDEKQDLHTLCESKRIRPHCILLDPPARGLSERIRTQLVSMRPQTMLYVSCDVATLARDLRFFLDAGYELDILQAIDLMPQTSHLETIARLSLPK